MLAAGSPSRGAARSQTRPPRASPTTRASYRSRDSSDSTCTSSPRAPSCSARAVVRTRMPPLCDDDGNQSRRASPAPAPAPGRRTRRRPLESPAALPCRSTCSTESTAARRPFALGTRFDDLQFHVGGRDHARRARSAASQRPPAPPSAQLRHKRELAPCPAAVANEMTNRCRPVHGSLPPLAHRRRRGRIAAVRDAARPRRTSLASRRPGRSSPSSSSTMIAVQLVSRCSSARSVIELAAVRRVRRGRPESPHGDSSVRIGWPQPVPSSLPASRSTR